MRLVYVITRSDAVGGASIHVRDLAREMTVQGHQVTVVVGGEGVVTDRLRAAGVAYRSLRNLHRTINPLNDARAYRELLDSLRSLRPDLVSTHTAKAGWLGRAACARLKIPVMYTPHGLSAPGGRFGSMRAIFFGAAERIAGPWSDAIVCVSDSERQQAIRNKIGPPNRLHVVHNGVRDVPESMRANVIGPARRIACVARLDAPKDHCTLLHAFAEVDPSWRLELIGDGPNESRIRSLARNIGVAERVVFHGYIADPTEILSQCQLFVLSSLSEAFPRSILEAMRAGLPVVATDVGGVAEAVKNGRSGLLTSPGSVFDMAGALVKLTSDPQRRQRMGMESHQTFRKQFSFDRMFEKTSKLYDQLVDRDN